MGFLEDHGLGTHLLIAGGLLLGVTGVIVGRNWSTFALMYDNLAAMSEGEQVAEQMHHPEDLLDYIAAHPDGASLVSYEVGARGSGIFYGANEPRPVVHTPHLLLLAEYARQVEANRLDPDRPVSLDSLALYALPGAGEQSHQQALAQWREENALRADSTVAFRHVVEAISRFGDAAAADWFMSRLGRTRVQVLPERWGMQASQPPLPSSGLYLTWSNQQWTGADSSRLKTLRSLSRAAYTNRVYREVRALRRDSTYRRRERQRLTQRGPGLSVFDQRALAQATYPKGTATGYADLMARIVRGDLGSPAVARSVRDKLESPVEGDSLQTPIAAIGATVGAMPGMISFVGYTRSTDDEPPRVSALFLENLPIAVFYHLVQTGLDKGFQLRLLSDPTFFQRVRAQLSEGKTEGEPQAHTP